LLQVKREGEKIYENRTEVEYVLMNNDHLLTLPLVTLPLVSGFNVRLARGAPNDEARHSLGDSNAASGDVTQQA
jgi:hypothetical protein